MSYNPRYHRLGRYGDIVFNELDFQYIIVCRNSGVGYPINYPLGSFLIYYQKFSEIKFDVVDGEIFYEIQDKAYKGDVMPFTPKENENGKS